MCSPQHGAGSRESVVLGWGVIDLSGEVFPKEFSKKSMSVKEKSRFVPFLQEHNQQTWNEVLSSLVPSIHPVDQTASRIWFAFWGLVDRQVSLMYTLHNLVNMQLGGRVRFDDDDRNHISIEY